MQLKKRPRISPKIDNERQLHKHMLEQRPYSCLVLITRRPPLGRWYANEVQSTGPITVLVPV